MIMIITVGEDSDPTDWGFFNILSIFIWTDRVFSWRGVRDFIRDPRDSRWTSMGTEDFTGITHDI